MSEPHCPVRGGCDGLLDGDCDLSCQPYFDALKGAAPSESSASPEQRCGAERPKPANLWWMSDDQFSSDPCICSDAPHQGTLHHCSHGEFTAPPASSRHSDGEALDELLGTIGSARACCSRSGGCVDFPALAADVRALAARPAPPGDGAAEREALIEQIAKQIEDTLYEGIVYYSPGEVPEPRLLTNYNEAIQASAKIVRSFAAAPARLSGEGTVT